DLNNIWDRYYKVDKEHKRHHIGSGIGLSLAKELIEAHGMECGVESLKGEYSKFYFDIAKQ
ncbi:MAG: histidine kinase, partial [Erysipelotrichaceae bacterium]|nr:histidine kinase [Erysipelotrichaceae bacterium]